MGGRIARVVSAALAVRVFVSYASEDRPTAEQVVTSIRARGHDVFFDKDELPPGGTYEDRIEQAIDRADVFVFLISPRSVERGGFALTELAMARRKWPRPAGRVLPVMIVATDYALMPAYAKSVTILEPEGNIAAETAGAVEAMRRFPFRRLGYLALAVLAIGAGVFAVQRSAPPRAELAIAAEAPWPWVRGYFGAPGQYRIGVKVKNIGLAAGRLTGLRVRTEPRDALTQTDGVDFGPDAPKIVGPGQEEEAFVLVTPKIADLGAVEWRVCVDGIEGEICSTSLGWSPQHDFTPGTAFEIPSSLGSNAIAVARRGENFILATRNPGAVHEITASGAIRASREIEGEPTALYVDDTGVYVGSRGPNAVLRLTGDKFESLARTALFFPASVVGTFQEVVSSTPASLARAGDRLWIVTRGGASASGLMHVRTDMTDPQIPPFFDTVASALSGMNLASNGVDVWGSETNRTPASLFKLTSDKVTTYGGHDFEIASCASGVLVRASDILVPDCDGRVQAVREENDRLEIATQIDTLLGYKMDIGSWTVVNMRASPDVGAAFLVTTERTTGGGVTRSIVNRLKPRRGLTMPLDVEGISIADLAVQENAFMVILDDNRGHRQTLALKYE